MLFLSLDHEVSRVVENIKDAVLKSRMIFKEVDYQEAARYLALNWDADKCRRSRLKRVLLIRRGKRGTMPGLRGSGPRGRPGVIRSNGCFLLSPWRTGI